VTAWDAFHRQGPFVGSGGEAAFTRLPRSRDRRSAFRAKLRPVNGVLTPPWASIDPLPLEGRGIDVSTSFCSTRSPTCLPPTLAPG
jgi:hypothetical protein